MYFWNCKTVTKNKKTILKNTNITMNINLWGSLEV